jgi:hypothetical protein
MRWIVSRGSHVVGGIYATKATADSLRRAGYTVIPA